MALKIRMAIVIKAVRIICFDKQIINFTTSAEESEKKATLFC